MWSTFDNVRQRDAFPFNFEILPEKNLNQFLATLDFPLDINLRYDALEFHIF